MRNINLFLKKNEKILPLAIGFLIVVFIDMYVFDDLLKTTFQQDEFYYIGKAFYATLQPWTYYFQILSGYHFTPLHTFFFFHLVYLFGTDPIPYHLVDIFLHSINAALVFFIAFFLTRNRLVAVIAAVFFLVNSVTGQAVTWIGAGLGTLGNASFALGAMLCFLVFLEKAKKHLYYWALVFFVISLGFKESSLFLSPLFLLMAYFSQKEKRLIQIFSFFKSYILLVSLGVVLLGARIIPIFLSLEKKGGGQFGNATSNTTTLLNLVFYPLEGLAQVFIPYGIMYRLQNIYSSDTVFWGVRQYERLTSSDLFAAVISMIILFTLFVFVKFLFNGGEKKIIWFSLLYILLSFVPYTIGVKGSSYLESRYYYLASAGAGILFALLVNAFSVHVASYAKTVAYQKYMRYGLLLLLTLPYFWMHTVYIQKDVAKMVAVSSDRKKIIHSIEKLYPVIGEKIIFYTESDTAYYGLAEKILPFQSGPGQMLMVLYAEKGQLNPEFFRNDFLWNITDRGYAELGGQGFGYFRDIRELRQALKKNHLPAESVFAFRFQKGKVKDISDDIRRRVSFSSDESFIKSVLYGEKALRYYNDRIVYFDLKNTLSTQENELVGAQNIENYKDKLYTARSYTHAGWIGANLVHYQNGFKGRDIILSKILYGYNVVSVGSVSVNNINVTIQSIQRLPNGDWKILLENDLIPTDLVDFGLWVSVYQIDIDGKNKTDISQYDVNDIQHNSQTTVLRLTSVKKTNVITLQAGGKIGSLPINDKRKTVVFLNGTMTEIKGISMITPDMMQITFNNLLNKGDLVEIPVFVEADNVNGIK